MRIIATVLLLTACAELDEVSGTDPTASEAVAHGSTTTAESCHRTGTESLLHLDSIAPGFDVAPRELVDGVTGWFEGEILGENGVVEGELYIDDALGQARAIYQEGPGCTDYYEIGFSAELRAGDDLIDTGFAALLQARSRDEVRFGIRLPVADVEGALDVHATDLPPAEAELRIGGLFAPDGAWEGELDWVAGDQVAPLGAFVFWGD